MWNKWCKSCKPRPSFFLQLYCSTDRDLTEGVRPRAEGHIKGTHTQSHSGTSTHSCFSKQTHFWPRRKEDGALFSTDSRALFICVLFEVHPEQHFFPSDVFISRPACWQVTLCCLCSVELAVGAHPWHAAHTRFDRGAIWQDSAS